MFGTSDTTCTCNLTGNNRSLYQLTLRRCGILARLAGLGPTACCFEGRCSVQLSYRRTRRVLERSGLVVLN